MNVTINDAINAFNLLREHVNENGFLHECYNLGISALKTVQDGNYQLNPLNVSRETLKEMANFYCGGIDCSNCKYKMRDARHGLECMSVKAKHILRAESYIKEVELWIKQNSTK